MEALKKLVLMYLFFLLSLPSLPWLFFFKVATTYFRNSDLSETLLIGFAEIAPFLNFKEERIEVHMLQPRSRTFSAQNIRFIANCQTLHTEGQST